MTSIPQSVFDQVGLPAEITNIPKKVTGHAPLTDPGLPEMLYEGAEYCPFCAAERWAMVMALSKFGTFSGLQLTNSSVSDFAPDTATFSFHGSTYTSQYLAFKPLRVGHERAGPRRVQPAMFNTYACLDTPPAAAANLLTTLGGGSFPFMDFGNKLEAGRHHFGNQPLVLGRLTASESRRQLKNPVVARWPRQRTARLTT